MEEQPKNDPQSDTGAGASQNAWERIEQMIERQTNILVENKNKKNRTPFVLFFLSIIINIALIYGYHFYYATKIKVYDMNGLVKEIQEEILNGKISQKEAEEKLRRVAEDIKKVPPKTVVLFEDIVLHNGEKIEIKNEKTK